MKEGKLEIDRKQKETQSESIAIERKNEKKKFNWKNPEMNK